MKRVVGVIGLILGLAWSAHATEGRILKVLPHLVDSKGRHALSPSLYERDAYQAELRKYPSRVSGLRFDIHWRARGASPGPLRLKLELRTASRPESPPLVLEAPVAIGFWGRRWTTLALAGDAYREAGSVLAWKATLLEGDQPIATKQSFLW